MSEVAPPLVLVHGLFDTPGLFHRLSRELGERRRLLIPHLPHALGATPLDRLAGKLGAHIERAFGPEEPVDVMGFSMGGLIARAWIQLHGGAVRTRRFISVASPQRGSLAALPWPRFPLAGVADMKPGSKLLRRLDADLTQLRKVECHSFFCTTDLVVVPGWKAVLPVGPSRPLPGLLHNRLMANPRSLQPVVEELLRP